MLISVVVTAQLYAGPADDTEITRTAPPANDSIVQIQYRLKELETSHGPDDPVLIDVLYELGQLYFNTELYDEADQTLERALDISKSNKDTGSLSQRPLLESLIKIKSSRGQWPEVDQNYLDLLELYRSNLGPDDPAILPIILEIGQWKLIAYRFGLLSEKASNPLLESIELFDSAVDILKEHHGEITPRLIVYLKLLAVARYYYIQNEISKPVNNFPGKLDKEEQACYTVILSDGGGYRECNRPFAPDLDYYGTKQIIKNNSIKNQKDLVEKSLDWIVNIYELDPSLSYGEHSIALLNLGDWYLLNNNLSMARKRYKEAYDLLVKNNVSSVDIENLFGKPELVMSRLLPGNEDLNTQVVKLPYVKFSFTISRHGKAKNIKVIGESNAENYAIRKTAREQLKNYIFRPGIHEGKPVVTRDFEMVIYPDIAVETD